MSQLRARRRRKQQRNLGLRSEYLVVALAFLLPHRSQITVGATSIDAYLDPEVHVTRAALVHRGLKHAGNFKSEPRPSISLKHDHPKTQEQPNGPSQANTTASQAPGVPAAEASSLSEGLRVKHVESNAEPQEWLAHFQRRRLHQTGSVGGDIIAISPSGAPLLRRADRNIPTAAPAGGVGVDSDDLSILSTKDIDNDTSSSFFASSGVAPAPSSGDDGSCNTLAYQNGYASFQVAPYTTFRFTSNKDQCCELCEDDPDCVAWSRIAGGQSSVRTCYLMNSMNLTGGAPPPMQKENFGPTIVANAAVSVQSIGPSAAPTAADGLLLGAEAPGAAPSHYLPQIQGGSPVIFSSPDSAVIIESGTKSGLLLPPQYYGCPYPPSSSNPDSCAPPPYCNCYDDVCYGSCHGNELMDAFEELAG